MCQLVITMFGTDIKGKVFDNYAEARIEANRMNKILARNGLEATCKIIRANDYKYHINALKHEGIPYRTFINDDGNMVIRHSEYGNNYTELIFNPSATLIQIITMQNGFLHIQKGE